MMTRQSVLGIVLGILLAAGIVGVLGCFNLNAPWCSIFLAEEETANSAPNEEAPNRNLDKEENGGEDENNRNGNGETPQEKQNIIVTSPKPNEEIGLPVVIKGEARVFESAFSYRVRDENGSILTEGHDTAHAEDTGQFGPFEVVVTYPKPKGDRGTIEVFSGSPKDGSEINRVAVPVKFKAVESMNVKVYFGNKKEDPAGLQCEKTHAVERRVPKTATPLRAALEELLKGPTGPEFEHSYFTSINTGVTIQNLSLVGGTANIDFNDMLGAGVGGACRVAAIRAQITDTMKQFSSVKSVQISIEGKVADILQP